MPFKSPRRCIFRGLRNKAKVASNNGRMRLPWSKEALVAGAGTLLPGSPLGV